MDYIKITPNGTTYHLASGRIKTFGQVVRPTTYCGLWIHPHSTIVSMEEPPDTFCKVCRKRSQAST